MKPLFALRLCSSTKQQPCALYASLTITWRVPAAAKGQRVTVSIGRLILYTCSRVMNYITLISQPCLCALSLKMYPLIAPSCCHDPSTEKLQQPSLHPSASKLYHVSLLETFGPHKAQCKHPLCLCLFFHFLNNSASLLSVRSTETEI